MNAIVRGVGAVNERFRQTVDSVPMLVSVSDAEKRAVYFNTQWRSFTGHTLGELIGEGWINDVHPEDRRHCIDVFERAFSSREKFSLEYRLRRHDGEYHYVLDAGAPEFSDDGTLLGYVSTAIDVTGQKLAQSAARHSEMPYGAVLDATIGNVAVVDCAGRIIAVNEGWLQFARQHDARLRAVGIGVNYLEICQRGQDTDGTAAMAMSGISGVLEGSAPVFSLEYSCSGPAENRWFEVIVHPLRRVEGGAIITHLDITSRRDAEMQAQSLLQELTHVNRVAALGELTASFAHELGQPLTAILSNAQTARRMMAGKQFAKSKIETILSDIIADNQRAGKIIDRLRTLLKKGELRFGLLGVNKLIREISELLADEAISKGIKVALALDPDVSLVWGDRIQLQQVILNLMVNSFEAMQSTDVANRRLTIETSVEHKDKVVILARDSGPGIPASKLEHIFEPFFTTKPHGLGMGLAICRSIIQTHLGEISCVNNADGGVTFRIALPGSRHNVL
jgi:two-component system, LuxR family, sensor kinase FixL